MCGRTGIGFGCVEHLFAAIPSHHRCGRCVDFVRFAVERISNWTVGHFGGGADQFGHAASRVRIARSLVSLGGAGRFWQHQILEDRWSDAARTWAARVSGEQCGLAGGKLNAAWEVGTPLDWSRLRGFGRRSRWIILPGPSPCSSERVAELAQQLGQRRANWSGWGGPVDGLCGGAASVILRSESTASGLVCWRFGECRSLRCGLGPGFWPSSHWQLLGESA